MLKLKKKRFLEFSRSRYAITSEYVKRRRNAYCGIEWKTFHVKVTETEYTTVCGAVQTWQVGWRGVLSVSAGYTSTCIVTHTKTCDNYERRLIDKKVNLCQYLIANSSLNHYFEQQHNATTNYITTTEHSYHENLVLGVHEQRTGGNKCKNPS